jgi:GNAT superfamily N-acetyltransferase
MGKLELHIKIRKGKIQDFKKLNHEWAWSPNNEWQQIAQKDYANGIQAGTQEFWVIEKGDDILGEFHIYWNMKDKDKANGVNRAYLSAFRVHPDYRGQGLGTKLMQRVIERIKERGFNEVTIGAYHHEPAIQDLYKKWGFGDLVKECIEETTEGKPKFLLFMKKL